jgi:hypothetical protein
MVGIDNISRAILLKFGYTFRGVSSNHQCRGFSISHTMDESIVFAEFSSTLRVLRCSIIALVPPVVAKSTRIVSSAPRQFACIFVEILGLRIRIRHMVVGKTEHGALANEKTRPGSSGGEGHDDKLVASIE